MDRHNDDEVAAVLADGEAALRAALTTEGMAYAVGRCLETYARALDGAQHVADAGGLNAADRRAYLSYMDTLTRTSVVAEAVRRRDEEVLFASRQLAEWRRRAGARVRSIPQSLHQFFEE
jgi:hypothetical protein